MTHVRTDGQRNLTYLRVERAAVIVAVVIVATLHPTWAAVKGTARVVDDAADVTGSCNTNVVYVLKDDTNNGKHYCCVSGTWAACDQGSGGGGAPTDATYWTASADGTLSAEVVVNDSAGLAAALSDETGTGAAVFGTSPTIDAAAGVFVAPVATSEGTCSSAEAGRTKRIETTGAYPYWAICADLDGAGLYYSWVRINEESSAGFIPPETEAVRTFTSQSATDNDAACVAVDVPYACCTGAGTGACTETAWPVGVLSDGVLYGRGSADAGASDCETVLKSEDSGESWAVVSAIGASATACIRAIHDLGDGEVLVHTTAELLKSTGWPTPSAWTKVLLPTGADQDGICTASGTPLDCCTGSGTGTCNVATNSVCTALDTPLDCCTGSGTGTCEDAANDATFQPWAVDTWGSYVFVTEYLAGGDPVHWDHSRYAYLSIDDGDSFDRVGDVGLESTAGTGLDDGQKVHIHGTAIDPWAIVGGTPRLWWSHHRAGSIPNNAQLYWSDDLGTTWNGIDIDPSDAAVDGIQPTTLRAAKYGIVAGTDYEPEGFQRILRRSDPDMMQPEMLIESEYEGVSNGFTKRAWRDPRNGIVLDTYSQINKFGSSFVGMSDGKSGNIVRYHMPIDDGTPAYNADSCTGVDTPVGCCTGSGTGTCDDYIYWGAFVTWAAGEDAMVLAVEDNATYKYETMAAPARGSMPDRWFNKGNIYPPADDVAHTSVAVGIDSNAEDNNSVVVGYRARAVEAGGVGGQVVIGYRASATEPGQVVVGSRAGPASTGASDSVVIGDESTVDFQGITIGSGIAQTGARSTVIGGGITGNANTGITVVGEQADGSGNNAVAIGRLSDAALNSVAVGYLADGTTTDCTSIGQAASCDHGRSVALGNDTQTDATDQVAIGDRTIVHQDSGGFKTTFSFTAPTANRTITVPDDDVTIGSGGSGITTIVKSTDETVNSTTTLQADDELTVPVMAGRYIMTFHVYFTTTATPDFKFNITCPTQNAAKIANSFHESTATEIGSESLKTACGWTSTTITATDTGWSRSEVYIDLSAAGNVVFNWAQNTSDPGDTTVNAGSWVKWEKVD